MATSDTSKLTFQTQTSVVKYGDKKSFVEYQIVIYKGKRPVGIEDGPSRLATTETQARNAAHARMQELRKRRLYAVRVTAKNITDGTARDCNACAIAQALWCNQERMGLPRREFNFEVSPYACFVEARGIVLSSDYGRTELRIPDDALPDLVVGAKDGRVFRESMYGWAMGYDDWAEARSMHLSEWREQHGYEDGERPYRPGPCSFVLDLDALKPVAEAGY